jgi:hypothetical protein
MKKYKKIIDEDALMNNKDKQNISLKDYFDLRINELKGYIDIKFGNIEKANSLAQDNLNARLETMNEFRNSMKDQASTYITRTEYNLLIGKYDSDIRLLREANAENKGKASQQSVNYAYLIAFIGIVIGVVGIIMNI